MSSSNSALLSFTMWVSAAGIFFAGLIARDHWSWIPILIFILLYTVCLSKKLTGSYIGVLVNDLYMMSLSRFQMALWTFIFLTFFTALALARVKSGKVYDPLNITVPWEIWTLLGIQTTALIGSPLIASGKKTKSSSSQVAPDIPISNEKQEDTSSKGESAQEKKLTSARPRPKAKGVMAAEFIY